MQIVIDIDENYYKAIKEIPVEQSTADMLIIRNGTPLPKGHGRLIAEPTEGDIAKTVGGQNDFAECIRDAVKTVFDNAPTIIEADMRREK